MTTPEAFEYNDDSVVARVSVDIPNQAVSDISQLTSAMGAMRTELEAISRAQSDWLTYLQQMPVIVEQSNQAIRNQITLMERMSYLQSEVGSSGAGTGVGEPAFSADGSGTGGFRPQGGANAGAAGGYSTAAPAGYTNPFADMLLGTGAAAAAGAVGGGGVAGGDDGMAGADPRTLANMAAARGLPINPGMIGMLGGIASAVLGRGMDAPGSQSPQKGNAKRASGGAPNPEERGQAAGSEGQDEPGEPGEGASGWEYLRQKIRENIKNEKGQTASSKDIRDALLKKGASKMFGSGGMTKLAKGGLLVGGGILASQVQNIGEDITEYQQLGSVRGGDFMTGMGMELDNRVRALDPFVNLSQTREAMQAAYSNGFMGDSVSQVQDQAISNFKELGMSMQETARMMALAMQGKDRTDSGATLEERTKLDAVVRTMKDLSADGGLSSDARRAQLGKAMSDLAGTGPTSSDIEASELKLQQAYGDTVGLGENVSQIATNVSNSQTLMAVAGQRVGITGIVPSAMKKAMSEAGYDRADILQIVAKETVQQVSGITPKLNRIGTFMDLMNQQGAEIPTYEDAEKLYDSVASGQNPIDDAEKSLANKRPKLNIPGGGLIKGANDLAMKALNLPGKLFSGINNHIDEMSRETLGLPSKEDERTAALFTPTGKKESTPPASAADMPSKVTTDGKVTGNVTITVDQNGKVTAPPTIQLTGLQKSALAGWGSSQVNNVAPGDSHSSPPLGGGR